MKRFLTTGPNEVTGAFRIDRYDGPGDLTPSPIVNLSDQVIKYDYKETTGFDTPNFYARVKRDEIIPMTPFEQFTVSESVDEYEYDATRISDGRREISTGLPTFAFAEDRITKSELESKASEYYTENFVQAAASAIYASGWDGLTFAVEFHKTLALFRDLLGRWRKAMDAGKFEEVYLESRYGWRLLKFDIEDINNLLKNLNDERSRFRESVGTDLQFTELTTETRTTAVMDYAISRTTDFKIGLRGTVVADIKPPKVRFNPLTTFWETIRYSFIIDWVIGVGQALEAMSFLVLASSYTAAAGIYIQADRRTSLSVPVGHGWSVTSRKYEATSSATYTLRRPTSVSYSPLIKLNLDTFKVLDLVALFVQSIKRRK